MGQCLRILPSIRCRAHPMSSQWVRLGLEWSVFRRTGESGTWLDPFTGSLSFKGDDDPTLANMIVFSISRQLHDYSLVSL